MSVRSLEVLLRGDWVLMWWRAGLKMGVDKGLGREKKTP
jgi:hypothetical protein